MYIRHWSYKIVNIVMIVALVINITGVSSAQVAASLVAPTAPSAPTAPNAPTSPVAPTAPGAPTAPVTPTPTPTKAPTAPKQPKQPSPTPTPTPYQSQTQVEVPAQPQEETEQQVAQATEVPSSTQYGDTTGKQTGGYGVGDAVVATGDANVSANLSTQANTNAYATTPQTSDITAQIYQNGAETTNVIDYSDTAVKALYQENNLFLHNGMDVEANSGDNTIAKNTGGSNTIKTGDASAHVNVFNFGNANFANVSLAEFDAYDITAGDIYLDSLSYTPAQSLVANTEGNGAGSTNTTQVGTGSTVLVFQDNFAEVTNDIDIEVNTGGNEITKSMGDATIVTGDANVVANIVNFLNTNFVGLGNLLVGVVNIFDGYQGDIYLPDTNNLALTNPNTSVMIDNNGAGSTNGVTVTDEELMMLTQNNTAIINNTINIDAVTGKNDASLNTGGNIAIKTGDIDSHVSTTTIAGQNFIANGDTLNLVFVNRDGVITPYYVDIAGNLVLVPQVYAGIGGNGPYSENIIATSDIDVVDITQNNTALVTNNLNIKANTGNNTIDKNTGGDISIETGDVSVLASVTNFVGNNFIGHNLVITFVNALGDWTGSILPSWAKNSTAQNTVLDDDVTTSVESGETNSVGPTAGKSVAYNQDVSSVEETPHNEATRTTQETAHSQESKTSKPALTRFPVSGLLGILGNSVGGDESGEDQDSSGLIAGGVSDTIPVYHPTIDTSSFVAAAIDFSAINPFKLIALAGFVLLINTELRKKLGVSLG